MCVYLCGDGGVGRGLVRGLGVLGGGELGVGVPAPPHPILLLLLLLLLVVPFILRHLQRSLVCGGACGVPPAEAEGRDRKYRMEYKRTEIIGYEKNDSQTHDLFSVLCKIFSSFLKLPCEWLKKTHTLTSFREFPISISSYVINHTLCYVINISF